MSVAKPKHVLVPVDFSGASFAAVQTALEFVDSPEQVSVLFVLPARQSEADFIREAMSRAGGADRAEVELVSKLKALGYDQVKTLIAEGSPAEIIAQKAGETGADLVVIPSHSRSGLPRLFLGSVASQVLRVSPCPVLVLRREED